MSAILKKTNFTYFEDIKWAFMSGLNIQKNDYKMIFNEVINSQLV